MHVNIRVLVQIVQKLLDREKMQKALIKLLILLFQKDPFAFLRLIFLLLNVKDAVRVLDAGCGMGGMTILVSTMARNVIGVNYCATEIEIARKRAKRLNIKNIEFLTLDLKNLKNYQKKLGKFDHIILFEVIEHIKDDNKLIEDLSFLLKESGKILLTTPYVNRKLLPGEYVSEIEDGSHVRWGYDLKMLDSLLRNNGFIIERIQMFGGPITYYLAYIQRVLSANYLLKLLFQIVTYLARPLQFLDSLIIKFVFYPPYLIGVVARKANV